MSEETNNIEARISSAGFAFLSPEVVMLHLRRDDFLIHLYPSSVPEAFSLVEGEKSEKKNVVLLRAPEKRAELIPFADQIHRLLIFSDPLTLQNLGVTIVDVVLHQNEVDLKVPLISENLFHHVEESCQPLKIQKTVRKVSAEIIKEKPKRKSKFTLEGLLKKTLPLIEEATVKKEFRSAVINRIMHNISEEDYQDICLWAESYGLSKSKSRLCVEWVEGDEGTFLRNAIETYFSETVADIEKLADNCSTSSNDMKLAISFLEDLEVDED